MKYRVSWGKDKSKVFNSKETALGFKAGLKSAGIDSTMKNVEPKTKKDKKPISKISKSKNKVKNKVKKKLESETLPTASVKEDFAERVYEVIHQEEGKECVDYVTIPPEVPLIEVQDSNPVEVIDVMTSEVTDNPQYASIEVLDVLVNTNPL